MKFSVIINNFNYDGFIAQAIDSALALDWPDIEVIVIDDGSTDRSWDVIQGYGSRIKALRVRNGGQNACLNIAFPHSSGDIVIVLDSDDIIEPNAAAQIAAVWTPATANVRYALQHYDVTMTRKGHVWPIYDARHTPDYMRRALRRTGTCPYSVTSGNAWARGFLDAILPVAAGPQLRSGFDQLLSRLAPLFGDVIALPQSLARYRVHDRNVSQIGTFAVESIQRAVQNELVFHREITTIMHRHGLGDPAENTSEPMMTCRLICKRLVGGPSYASYGWARLLRRYWSSILAAEVGLVRKGALLGWSIAATILPRPLADRVCALRYRANRQF